MITALALLALLTTAVVGTDLQASVLLVTGSFTLVYVVGTAAAVRLLPPATLAHAGAVVSLVAVTGLLVLTGRHVLLGVAVALTALAYEAAFSRRSNTPNLASPSRTLSERIAP